MYKLVALCALSFSCDFDKPKHGAWVSAGPNQDIKATIEIKTVHPEDPKLVLLPMPIPYKEVPVTAEKPEPEPEKK